MKANIVLSFYKHDSYRFPNKAAQRFMPKSWFIHCSKLQKFRYEWVQSPP